MWTCFLLILASFATAKVDPPNYDFSLITLEKFYPGKKVTQINQEFGAGEKLQISGNVEAKKYYVEHIRYKFPVIIHYFQDEIIDMYAVLPSYFLHDVFHQSLINRVGKQNQYKIYNGTALYIWKEKNELNYFYSATCTITCFPLYFSVTKSKKPANLDYKPMIDALSAGHL